MSTKGVLARTQRSVSARLPGAIRPIRSRYAQGLIFISLGLISISLLVIFMDRSLLCVAGDPMFVSGLVTAGVILIVFQHLMQVVPDTFETLWQRGIICVRDQGRRKEELPTPGSSTVSMNTMEEAASSGQYHSFMRGFEGALNHWGQWIISAGFVVLVPTLIWQDHIICQVPQLYVNCAFGVEVICAVAAGMMFWRLLVIGVWSWRLGKLFDIRPKLGHPDQCCGLEPLGNMCLWNAAIASIAGLFLGSWLILVRSNSFPDKGYSALVYEPVLSKLLLPLIILACISFVLPVWSIHELLVQRREELQRQLDQLAMSIDKLAHKMLDSADDVSANVLKEGEDRLAQMQQVYQQNKRFPEWPFNTSILSKFAVAQALPVLSLTQLGKPVGDLIAGLIKSFLGQS